MVSFVMICREGGARVRLEFPHRSHKLNFLITYFVWSWTALLASATWWLLNVPRMDENYSAHQYCSSLRFLAPNQRKLCESHPTLMNKISMGVRSAVKECQFQFRHNHWNCTMYPGPPRDHAFKPIIKSKGREKAFVHSIIAANVAYEITRACTSSDLPKECECARRNRKNPAREFEWRGCSDDINFGVEMSQRFLDADVKPRSLRNKMQLHNNEAGRNILRNKTLEKCKCHGLSGTCTQKICWESMPPLQHVGRALKSRYDGAVRVRMRNGKLRAHGRRQKQPTPATLVYENDSGVDFCARNVARGAYGTHGRKCNATSRHTDGCEIMCCARGFRTESRLVKRDCNCRFEWCCRLDCERCEERVTESFCK